MERGLGKFQELVPKVSVRKCKNGNLGVNLLYPEVLTLYTIPRGHNYVIISFFFVEGCFSDLS